MWVIAEKEIINLNFVISIKTGTVQIGRNIVWMLDFNLSNGEKVSISFDSKEELEKYLKNNIYPKIFPELKQEGR